MDDSKPITNPSLPGSRDLTELLMGVGISIGFAALVFYFHNPYFILGFFVLVAGIAILWSCSQYLPVLLLWQLAFSLEISISAAHRLTIPTEPIIIFLALTVFFRLLFDAKLPYRSSQLNIAVWLLYGVMILSLYFTWQKFSTIKAIIRDSGYILAGYYILPYYIDSEIRLKKIMWGVMVTHLLLVLYGFGTQIVGGIRIYGNIAGPFFVEHCIYAAFITVTFSFLLAFFLEQKPGSRRFYLGIITSLFAVAIILTFVRAAWFSVMLLLLFYLYHYREKRGTADIIVALLLFALVGFIFVATTDMGKLFTQRINTVTDLQYVANYDRLDRWVAAWNIWKNHPFFGCGWGAYPDVYPYFSTMPGAYSTQIRMGAHNLYLEILAETGIVGFGIFVSMIFLFYRQLSAIQKKTHSSYIRTFSVGAQGAMMTYLFHAFLNNLGPSDKIELTYWFLLGLVPTLTYLVSLEEDARLSAEEVASTGENTVAEL